MPANDLHSAIADAGLELPDDLLTEGDGLRVGASRHQTMQSLAGALRSLVADRSQPLASEKLRREVERGVREAFFETLSGLPVPQNKLRTARRHEKLRRAREYLAEHAHEPIYLLDLCRATGLGQRALQSLFRDLLGVSPITYLQRLRLHRVRRELLRSGKAPGTVKRVALTWRFWHLGNFAADYGRLFGECPSQTLISGSKRSSRLKKS